jgi:hypothetical protein
MRLFPVLLLGGSLICNFTALAETNPSDQKWLEVVEKKVAKGEHKVTTHSEERVNLLKAWGKENGYSVHVTKTESGYTIEITKGLASN